MRGHDVSDAPRVEESLQSASGKAEESLSLLKTLFRAAPVGLAFIDRDLRYVHINDALAEINGFTAGEHLGRRLGDVLPGLAPTLEPLYRRVMETRRPIVNLEVSGETVARPGELRHWLANYYPVEAGDAVLGVGIVVVEVTERKRSQEAIRRERDLSQALIHTAQCIVLLLDRQGRISLFNPYMESVSGYTLEEVRGRSWFETFLPQQDQPRIREVFERALERIETRGNINPILAKDGSERQISWWDKALTDADGKVLGLLCIGHDITDLLEAQERALRAERLAAIGETITTIAHESRSELDAIGFGLTALAGTHFDDARQKRLVALLREGQGRLQHLFDDLRSFAAPVRLERAPCDLSELWRRAWKRLVSGRESHALVLKEEMSGGAPICSVDALRMERVFRNLFENALAACSHPVEVEVCCTEGDRGDGREGARPLRLAIRDNGLGLTAAQRERIFEPFVTTRSQGTGLGLAIVRRIVEAHGGSIVVGDVDRRGAEFVMTLPRAG